MSPCIPNTYSNMDLTTPSFRVDRFAHFVIFDFRFYELSRHIQLGLEITYTLCKITTITLPTAISWSFKTHQDFQCHYEQQTDLRLPLQFPKLTLLSIQRLVATSLHDSLLPSSLPSFSYLKNTLLHLLHLFFAHLLPTKQSKTLIM